MKIVRAFESILFLDSIVDHWCQEWEKMLINDADVMHFLFIFLVRGFRDWDQMRREKEIFREQMDINLTHWQSTRGTFSFCFVEKKNILTRQVKWNKTHLIDEEEFFCRTFINVFDKDD